MNVYILRCIASGGCYVGKANNVSKRWSEHRTAARLGHRGVVYNAMRKYGAESFTVQTIEECSSEAEAFEREAFWVDFLDSTTDGCGYNLRSGGKGGYRPSSETRLRMSAAGRGRPKSREHVEKVIASVRRMWAALTPEQRLKKGDQRRGKRHTVDARAKIAAKATGRPRSVEASAKQAEKIRGRKRSRDDVEKTMVKLRGRKHTKERLANMSAGLNPKRVGVGETTFTIRELAIIFGFPRGMIDRRLAGGWSVERACTTPARHMRKKAA